MIPGMDPRQMKQAMRKMGIVQEEIDATEVIIRTSEKEIIITDPQVSKIRMMGQESFQVSGTVSERERCGVNDEDIKTVMGQAGVEREAAEKALKQSGGDLAKAIISLQEEEAS